jgi:methyl-accepting chemotaxis protein
MTRPNILARKYLVNKPLQIKYALLIGAALAVMIVLVEVHTYLTIQSILPNLFSSFMGREVRAIQFWLMVNGLVYLLVVAALSVVLSNRIAGPLYRLETVLKEVIESGDPSKRIVLRKGDELQSLADLLNRLLERMSRKP